jgi:hypothetical protein
MRIAVSGTHGVGKSTLVDEFLRLHSDFAHEPEPYTVLVEDFGEEFADEPCVEDFRRQLVFNIERLDQHAPGTKVIYERCPIDFLAYIAALDARAAQALIQTVSYSLQHLDLIAYLPLDDNNNLDADYPKLQKAVDRRLSAIFRGDEFGIISANQTIVIEAEGPTPQRLQTIQRSLKA